MSCQSWHEVLASNGIGELPSGELHRLVAHLSACRDCRAWAVASDPTWLLTTLPVLEVPEQEVEDIRRTVQAMRQLRVLDRSRRRPVWRSVGLAALLLVAVTLAPTPPTPEVSPPPFTAALGVGAGPTRLGDLTARYERLTARSAIENLEPRGAQVWHRTGDRIDFVLIVDESYELEAPR